MEHAVIPSGHIHAPHNWRVATPTARLALSVTTADVGKLCWQQDDNSQWLLVTASPVTWAATGGGEQAMADHLAAVDPHSQYTTTVEAAAAAPVQSVSGKTGAVALTKADVGLTDVDNTSDASKPISTAVQTALNNKSDTAHTHSTYQPLDADLTAIAGLTGASGLLRKTAADTWILDTTEYAVPPPPMGVVGAAGSQGFGVGIYPDTLPTGFTAMTGTTDKASANYGNYTYSDGSIMVFVPKFYYRIGSNASAQYVTYGANALDIVGNTEFADEAAANTAGFALHRAFKDGGAVKSGFFIDKYLASKTGTTGCKSIFGADPISLSTTTNAAYNPSNGMTGCTGILADAVVLARSRGPGTFNVASIFMYDALAKLSLAHGQASTSATNCAWYDAAGTTNFPKGCNDALSDINDTSVTYVRSYSTKPKTGAITNFAKTTHNGQGCGVTDTNGSMWQTMLGVVQAGTSATDATAITTGNSYVLKTSVALASLTGGWGGATDAWGTTANLATNYDSITGFLPWGGSTGWDYFGNGTAQVFSGATSGTDYLRSCSGIAAVTGMSGGGTSQFGNDANYRYGCSNLFPLASGYSDISVAAGAFYRYWAGHRAYDHSFVGFRAAAYGN